MEISDRTLLLHDAYTPASMETSGGQGLGTWPLEWAKRGDRGRVCGTPPWRTIAFVECGEALHHGQGKPDSIYCLWPGAEGALSLAP